MRISYNWLQDLINQKLPKPEELADLLMMHSFETELIGKEGKDYIFEADILPNRAHDCLGHRGIAREIAAILDLSLKEINYAEKIKQSDDAKKFLEVKVEDKELCPRYTGRVLTNVKVEESPKWLKDRLTACDLRPINNIVDAVNYVMLETGQPLHAFDADKLAGKNDRKTIIVRKAKKGEKIVTLENEKYDLDENVLLIVDSEKPLCIAGIKGGKKPEVDKTTKNIILEAANFLPLSIRKTSQKLKLRTDASIRFEHGLDPNLTEPAINMAAYLIQDIASGQVAKGLVDVYPKKIKPKEIKLDMDKVKTLLGIDISEKQVKNILSKLGFESSGLKFMIPTQRLDVNIQEDLIEEIGRLYGYENIPSQFPTAALIPIERNEDLFYKTRLRNILIGLGFNEAYNYSFVSEKGANLYTKKPDFIEVSNPLSREQKYMRPSLALNLLKNIRENNKYFDEVKLFEIGRIFHDKKGTEHQKIAAIALLRDSDKDANEFYRLKGVLDSLLNQLRISGQWYDDELNKDTLVPDFCHSLRRAEVKADGDYLGWIGEIDKSVLDKIGLKTRVAAFEIDLGKIVELAIEERIYLPPSKYPAMVRDVAVIVEPATKVVSILNLINAAGGSLVRDIDLFDIYELEEEAAGRKSFAFHIIFQADDHNLTDKEVNKIHKKIIKVLEDEGGWEVRK